MKVAVAEFSSLLSHCRMHPVREVLIDYRDLEGEGFATLEIMYAHHVVRLYQEYLASGGAPLRIAYFGNEAFIGAWSPGVDVGRAAGMDVIATTDPEVVRAWLDGGEPVS